MLTELDLKTPDFGILDPSMAFTMVNGPHRFGQSLGRMLLRAILIALAIWALNQPWPGLSASSLAQSFPSPPSRTEGLDLADYPDLRRYDLGTTTLTQTGVPVAVQTMPLPLTGLIGVPPGPGLFPLVVILHGRHGGCHLRPTGRSQWPCAPGTETRYDLGFAPLAQDLVTAGFGVLVPNLNAAFSETYGATATTRNDLADQRSPQIIDAHLTRLAEANDGGLPDFGVALQGRIDLARLAMVGHSMGGGAAALSALGRQASPSIAAVAAGLGPVRALVLVSPTRSQSIQQRPDLYELPDVPSAVLAGGCDRDITDHSGLYYFETASQDPQRTTLATAVVLLGANHNFFNAAVGEDDYYRQADNAPLCDPQRSRQRLSRVAQEHFLSQYTEDFLSLTLADPANPALVNALGLAADRAAPGQIHGQPVLTNLALPMGQGYPVVQAGPSPQAVYDAVNGVRVERCQQFLPCGEQRPDPQFPGLLEISWSTGTGALHFPLALTDMSSFDSLQLRLAIDSRLPAPAHQPGFAILLRDRQGRAARVDIPPTVPALTRFAPDPTHGYLGIMAYPSALRIPLRQFWGIDLSALATVELVFDQTTQGRLYLASLGFVDSTP